METKRKEYKVSKDVVNAFQSYSTYKILAEGYINSGKIGSHRKAVKCMRKSVWHETRAWKMVLKEHPELKDKKTTYKGMLECVVEYSE